MAAEPELFGAKVLALLDEETMLKFLPNTSMQVYHGCLRISHQSRCKITKVLKNDQSVENAILKTILNV